MRAPTLYVDVEALVNNNNGVLTINQAIVDELGRRYGRRGPAYVYLTANIPFNLDDEQLRHIYKMLLVAEDRLNSKGLAVTAIVTPYDVTQKAELGSGFRYHIEPIAQCSNDQRRARGAAAFAQFASTPASSAIDMKTAMVRYAYEQTAEIDAPYTLYLDGCKADRLHIETYLNQHLPVDNRLVLSTEQPAQHTLQLNAQIARFLLAQKLQNDHENILDAIEQLRSPTMVGMDDLTKRQRNRLTEFLKEIERLSDITPIDGQTTSADTGTIDLAQVKLLTDLLIGSIVNASNPDHLVALIKQIDDDLVNNLQLRKLNVVLGHFLLDFVVGNEAKYVALGDAQAYKVIDYLDLVMDMTYGHKPLVQKIHQSLISLKAQGVDNTELLKVYTLVLSYLLNPHDAAHQKKMIEKCSECGQCEDKVWNQLSMPLAWLHLHASEDEKVALQKTHQKIELCKTTLKQYNVGNGPLRQVINDLLIKAKLMQNQTDQLALLRTLEASVNLLTEPDNKEVVKEFKAVTKKAQGKPSALWRSIGAILATLSVLVALIAIIALAAPIPVAAGLAVLLTVKTMFASHCAIAFGCAAAGVSTSLVCFFNGSSKNMHQSMSKLNKEVHKKSNKAVFAAG